MLGIIAVRALAWPRVGRGLTEEDRSGPSKAPSQWKVSDLDITLSEPVEPWDGRPSLLEGDSKESEFLNEACSQHTPLVTDSLANSAPRNVSSVVAICFSSFYFL